VPFETLPIGQGVDCEQLFVRLWEEERRRIVQIQEMTRRWWQINTKYGGDKQVLVHIILLITYDITILYDKM
jgi:hypothetical protein